MVSLCSGARKAMKSLFHFCCTPKPMNTTQNLDIPSSFVKSHLSARLLYINCVSELNCHPAAFRFVFCAQDELEALVGFVGKSRALRVQRIQPEVLTRLGRETPACNVPQGEIIKRIFSKLFFQTCSKTQTCSETLCSESPQ